MQINAKNMREQRGYSIIELMVVAAVLLVVSQAFVIFLGTISRGVRRDRSEAYATTKAVQMLEELRALVIDDNAEITVLDTYDDGVDATAAQNPIYKYTLTTKRDITHPGGNTENDCFAANDPISANPIKGVATIDGVAAGGYAFVRHVKIFLDPKDPNVRKIYVRIFPAAVNGGACNSIKSGAAVAPTAMASSNKPIAEVSGMVKSITSGNNPMQVMDMYLVALESVPGWWSRTSNLIPLMQSAIVNIQARNPGLRIRPHWIKRMSYGRDPEYTPEVNSGTLGSVDSVFDKAYIYPGLITYSNGNDYYYLPSWFKARINLDSVMTQNDGYSIADQFNHAMRYIDEDNLYDIHKTVAANQGQSAPEYSLRQMMQLMYDNDPSLYNSIVINLHGEMVPIVPLRNVSDAAKDPAYFTSVTWTATRAFRVVSHPRQLHYNSSTDTMVIDTYAYDMNPVDPFTATVTENHMINEATVFIPNAKTSDLKAIQRLQGNSTTPYHWYGWYANPSGLTYTASTQLDGGYASPWGVTGGVFHDSVTTSQNDSTWLADNYIDAVNGRSGLRVRFYGLTPTARAYKGPAWVKP